jgi:dihydrofolate reductase
MRKLKLQMQMSVDGFVAGPNGELDWMTWDWDDKIKKYVNDLIDSVDTILLGRKMTPGFVSYWTNVIADPENHEYPFARKMVDIPKVVFTKTLKKSEWENTEIANGDLTQEIKTLKNKKGKDIIVYGGAGFVSSLLKEGVIDEYYFFVNPAIIGDGMTISGKINSHLNLKMIRSIPFDCGIVVHQYEHKN